MLLQERYTFGTIFFGDETVSFYPLMPAHVRDGRENFVEIKETRLFFLNSKREPCLSEMAHEMVDRVVRCVENYTLEERGCRFLSFRNDHPRTELRSYCNMQYFDGGMDEAFEKCNKREIDDDIPCTQVQFETSVRDVPYNQNVTRIELKYRFTNYMMIKEQELYTWQTFLSNIGGLLSLLCGASVISLVQVFYYCCTHAAEMGKMRPKRSVSMRSSPEVIIATWTLPSSIV